MKTLVRNTLRLGTAATLATLATACGNEDPLFGTTEREVAPAGSAASFVSNTIPTTMAPGERINVQVVANNTGTVDWTPAASWGFRAANFDFGFLNEFLDTAVAQGATATENFIITAPATSATLNMNVYSFLGGSSGAVPGAALSIPVTVSGVTTPQWGCSTVSTTIPNPINVGDITTITVTVRNDGQQTWPAASQFCLYARDNADATNPSLTRWGSSLCPTLASSVAPGANADFTFQIQAPSTAGTYRFMRQMRDLRTVASGGVGFFRNDTFCVDEPIVVQAGTPTLGAEVVSETIPSTVAPNDIIPVTIRMRNTGSETWTAGSTYVLTSLNSPVTLWGTTAVNVPSTTANGQEVDFNFNMVVPNTVSMETLSYRMQKSGGTGLFGDAHTEMVDISGAETPALAANVVSANFPALMAPNSSDTATVRVRNNGTETWLGDGSFTLVSLNSPVDQWGVTSLPVTSSVSPGSSFTFTFTVASPNSTGSETFDFRMQKAGQGRFGVTIAEAVTLSGSVTPPYGATVTSQMIPSSMVANSVQSITVVMRNAGTNGWGANSDIWLFAETSPRTLFGTTSVQLGTATAIGVDATFTFNIIAPAVPGTYETRWRMHQVGGVNGFGDIAVTSNISVTSPAGCGDGTVSGNETCDDGNTTAGDGCSASCEIERQEINLASGGVSNRTFLGSQFNRQLSTMKINDLNGDGVGDLLSSDFTDIGEQGIIRNQAGRVYAHLGSGGFFTDASESIATNASLVLWGREAGDHLGGLQGGVRAADVTGDGNPDLVVGAQFADGTGNTRSAAGEVYVFVGGSNLYAGGTYDLATSSTVAPIGAQQFLGTTIVGEAADDRLGVVTLGDVTNDGTADIVAAAISNDSGGTSSGELYVIAGGASLATTSTVDLSSATIQARITGPGAGAFAGVSAVVGDVSGDGINDLVVSAPIYSSNGRSRNGVVYVLNGPVSGTYDLSNPAASNTRIVGETNNTLYGMDLAIGDFRGSSSLDLLVGAPQAVDGSQVGEVHVWEGPLSSGEIDNAVTAASTSIFGEFLDYVGASVEAGDTNGDGMADAIFGVGLSDGAANGSTNGGEMGVVLGATTPAARISWATFAAPFRVYAPAASDLMGYLRDSVAAGDLDGDGRIDWCAGQRLGGDTVAASAGRIDCFQSPW